MKKYLIFSIVAFVLLFPLVSVFGQVRPDQFLSESSPNDGNFEVYSQKNGVNKKAALAALRQYFAANIVSQIYPPPLSNNLESSRNKIIDVQSDGSIWYVDWAGYGIRLNTGIPLISQIASISDTTNITNPASGDFAIAGNDLLIRGIGQWYVFPGADGNGIYSGSGNVSSNTIATLPPYGNFELSSDVARMQLQGELVNITSGSTSNQWGMQTFPGTFIQGAISGNGARMEIDANNISIQGDKLQVQSRAGNIGFIADSNSVFLPDILNADALGTDASGKVVAKSINDADADPLNEIQTASEIDFDNSGTVFLSTDVQSAIIENANAGSSSILNTVFVAKNAVIAAEKYNILRPYSTPWLASDNLLEGESVQVYQGDYTYTGPYSTNPISVQSLAKIDLISYRLYGKTDLYANNVVTSFYPLFTDATSQGASAVARTISIIGQAAKIGARRQSASLIIPIAFYHPDTDLFVDLDEVYSKNGRTWGMQISCGRANVKVNKIDIDGGIALSVWRVLNESGEYLLPISRFINVKVGEVLTKNNTDISGAIRYQPLNDYTKSTNDFGSVINIEVDRIKYDNVGASFILFASSRFENSRFDLKVKQLIDNTNSTNRGVIVLVTQSSLSKFRDTIVNSIIDIEIGTILNSRNALKRRGFNGTSAYFMLESSAVNISVDRAKFLGNGGSFNNEYISLLGSSNFNVNCNDCVKDGTAAFFTYSNTSITEGDSRFKITGKFSMSAASPVISIIGGNARVVVNANLYNTGGDLITSSVPIVVYIGADSNVTKDRVSSNITLVFLGKKSWSQETFTATAAQTTYVVASTKLPVETVNLIVVVDGLEKIEGPGEYYTYVSSTGVITFNTAFTGGEKVKIKWYD